MNITFKEGLIILAAVAIIMILTIVTTDIDYVGYAIRKGAHYVQRVELCSNVL